MPRDYHFEQIKQAIFTAILLYSIKLFLVLVDSGAGKTTKSA